MQNHSLEQDRGEVESMIASLEDSRVRSEKDAEETHEILLETERYKRELEEELRTLIT